MTWIGIYASRNTPPAVIKRVQREIVKALARPEIAQRLAQDGLEPLGSTPEKFRDFLAADKRKWERIVKDVDIKPE